MAKKSLAEILGGKEVFGDYTVLCEGREDPKGRYARCRCKCGVVKDVGTDKLKSGRSTCCKSCAAASVKRLTNIRHGMSGSSEYLAWSSMVARCVNPNSHNYPRYGARGIQVCDRWKESFDSFFADMGAKPSRSHSLDRIDNNLHYSPDNCRWALPVEQSANRERTLKVEYMGETVATAILANRHGMSPATLAARLARGWNIEDALSGPVLDKKPRYNIEGRSMTASEIEKEFGVSRQRLNYRLRRGMDVLEAIKLG